MMANNASKPTAIVAIPRSGIHQFPAELLVQIFALCWRSFTPRFGDISLSNEDRARRWTLPAEVYEETYTRPRFKTEIARVAHAPLLAVAQVCAKWRSTAMGTSFLWCDIELDSALWNSPDDSTTAVVLLESTLKRGGDSPLHISLAEGKHPFPARVFDMLAAHSHRWQTFCGPGSFIDAFSGVQGRLPRLRRLQIDPSDNESGSLTTVGSMPSLNSLMLFGELFPREIRKLRLKRLRQLEWTTVDRFGTEPALSLMSLLPIAAEFRLGIHLIDDPEDWSDHKIELAIVSNISTFNLRLMSDFDTEGSLVVLECILQALTLPLLTRFELESMEYPHTPLLWPHRAFLALSARSSFDSTLRTLEIYDVHITQAQLLECLLHLPSLERLAISDHQPVAHILTSAVVGAYGVLITDAVFLTLTRTADTSCLVPRLSSLGCRTLMRFADPALLALAVSRLSDAGQSKNANGRHFGIELSWLSGHGRKLDEAVLARLNALKISTNRRFTFRMSAAEDKRI
ncbi:hypothetical protein C8R45DRAFT_464208 [Mycena sanguinolenta]|nr:hypothetical protein C8R45DRAFT_464208 [Mycena sanguinolenta]